MARYPKTQHFLAAGMLACFALVACSQLVLQPKGLLVGPQSGGRNDLTEFFLACRSFPREVLNREGAVPLWNPYLLEGSPWLGNPQSGLFYPPNWAYLLFEGPWLAGWMLVLHLWWGGFGVYFLTRRLGCGWSAGLVGGCAYLTAPYLLAQTGEGHYNQICLIAWIPWAFLVFERLRSGNENAWPRLSLVLACCFFCGHAQEFYYLVLFLSVLVLLEICVPERPLPGMRRKLIACWLGLGMLTVGLVAADLLPQFLCSKQAVRSGGLSLEQAGVISLDARSFRQLWEPFAFGGPENYRGPGSFFWETFFHFGWAALALAVWGILSDLRNRGVWRYVLVGVIGGVIAFGNSTPIYGWLFHAVPGFALFRSPGRGLFFTSFTVAVLAAMGTRHLLENRRRMLAGIGIVAILAVMGGETFHIASRVLAVVPEESLRREGPLSEFLSRHADGQRVLVHQDLLTDREAWSQRIRKVHGYDPVPLTRTAILFDALVPEQSPEGEIVGLIPADPRRFRPNVVELLGVKYAVIPGTATPAIPGWKTVQIGQIPPDVTLAGEEAVRLPYQILEKNAVFPRAYVLGKTRVLNGDSKWSAQLATVQPREEVLVDRDVLPAGKRQPFREAAIREYSPNRVVIEAELTQPGYLVLTDTFVAGWSATVDGNRTPIVPANVAFRGIPLLKGTHRVELTYSPPGFKIGAGISVVSLLIACALIARGLFKTDEPPNESV